MTRQDRPDPLTEDCRARVIVRARVSLTVNGRVLEAGQVGIVPLIAVLGYLRDGDAEVIPWPRGRDAGTGQAG